MMSTTSEWPSEIRLAKARDVLEIAFESGEKVALPAEYLRVSSPSAEVQGHGPNERKVIGGKRTCSSRMSSRSAIMPCG